jgi:hypothetical protein
MSESGCGEKVGGLSESEHGLEFVGGGRGEGMSTLTFNPFTPVPTSDL